MLRPLWVKGGCAARLSTSTLFPQQVLRTNNFNGLRVKRSSAAALNRKGFLGHCQNAARHTNIYGPRSDRRASLLVERQSGGSGKARQVESAKPVKMDFTITPPFLADCRYRHWPRKRQQPGCEPQSWSHCARMNARRAKREAASVHPMGVFTFMRERELKPERR
jgi:hypothetical protein